MKSLVPYFDYMQTIISHIDRVILLVEVESHNSFRLVYANKAFQRQVGFGPDTIGKRFEEFLRPERVTFLKTNYRKVLLSKEPHQYTSDSILSVGRRIFENKLFPIVNATGKCVYILSISADITGAYENECNIASLKSSLEATLSSLEREVVITDETGSILYTSAYFRNLLGKTDAKSPVLLLDRLAKPQAKKLKKAMEKAKQSPKKDGYSLTFHHKTAKGQILEGLAQVMYDATHGRYVIFVKLPDII